LLPRGSLYFAELVGVTAMYADCGGEQTVVPAHWADVYKTYFSGNDVRRFLGIVNVGWNK